MKNKISVVIPCFNGAAFIENAIESCFSEGVEGSRLIVIDDGSTDDTPAVLGSFGERIRAHRVLNGGPARARNIGLSLVETPYVIFLDADDMYCGGILSDLQARISQKNADLALGCTQNVLINGVHSLRKMPPEMDDREDFVAAWLNGKTVQTNSHMWNSDYLRYIGGFRSTMRILEEVEHVARASLLGAKIVTGDVGYSLYINRGNANRVSYGNSEAIIRSAVEGFSSLEPLLIGCRTNVRRALGFRLYMQARSAFRGGYVALGHDALQRARRNGFNGHYGSASHRLMSSVLGLECKERIGRVRSFW